MDHVVSKVCSAAGMSKGATIVIFDQTSFATLQAFEAFAANIKVLVAAYKTVVANRQWLKGRLKELADARKSELNSAFITGHFSAPVMTHLNEKITLMDYTATGDPFSDFTSLLQAVAVSSNVETPGSVTIPDSSLAIALTQRLTATPPSFCPADWTPFTVIYPPFFGKSSASDAASADIDLKLQILEDVRQAAHESVLKEITRQGPHEAKAKADGGDGSDPNALKTKALQDIDGIYDGFMNALLQINGSTGSIGSAAVIQGYRLANLLSGDTTWTLLATVVGAGGTEHDHKTFWTALGSGDKLTYSGGVIANVALWNSKTGEVKFAEVMKFKSAFKDADGSVGSP